MRLLSLACSLFSFGVLAQGMPAIPQTGTGATQVPTNNQLSTQAALNLFVDPVNGSDVNLCTSSGAGACATLQGAINKIPKNVRNTVIVTLATGTYSAAASAAYISGFVFSDQNTTLASSNTTAPIISIRGSRQVATVSAGLATGTVASAVAGSNGVTACFGGTNPGTWGTVTINNSGWTTNNLQGFWLNITGGTGAGQVRAISANTNATNGVITIAGGWDTVPDGTSTFEIDDCAVTLTTGGAALPANVWTNAYDPLAPPPAGAAETIVVADNHSRHSIGPSLELRDVCFLSSDGTGAVLPVDDELVVTRGKFTANAARKAPAYYPIGGRLTLDTTIGVLNASQRYIQFWSPDTSAGANTWPQGAGDVSGWSMVSMRRSAIFAGVTGSQIAYTLGGTFNSQQNEYNGGSTGALTGGAPFSTVFNTTGDHFDAQAARAISVVAGTSILSTNNIAVDGDVITGTGGAGTSGIFWQGTLYGTLSFSDDATTISSVIAGIVISNPGLNIYSITASGCSNVPLPTMSSVTCEYAIFAGDCSGTTTSKASIEAAVPKMFTESRQISIIEYP